MRSTLFIALALAAPFALAADGAGTQILRVPFLDRATVAEVARLHTHVHVDYARGVMTLEADAAERARLAALGLRYEVDVDATRGLNATASPAPLATAGIPGYACYRTVAETSARIDELAALYPALATRVPMGPSWERFAGLGGEELTVLKLGSAAAPGPKPVLFVMASVHAREYTPAETVLRFGEGLVLGYGDDPDATWILDHVDVHLLIHANPDGRELAETGLSWRKNTNQAYCGATSNSRGVDLNRNYPFEWGAHNGSSPNACDITYRGPAPTSEPETQAVVDYVRSLVPDQRGPALTDAAPADAHSIFLDVHSYSRLVLWPWGYTEQPAPNAAALETLGRRFAWFNGYDPMQAIGLYPTDGTTDDFAYGDLGLAAYTFELGLSFFESCANFERNLAADNGAALRYAARVASAPYRLPSGPDALYVAATPDLAFPGETIAVTARVDDGSFNQTLGGTQPLHAIAGADVAVDGAAATPVAAVPVDGALDTPSERVSATLDASALGTGRNLVTVQGRDASTARGPLGTVFVDVAAPETVGTLSGTVRDGVTGAPVAARLLAGGYGTATDATGAYARRVPAGTHTLDVRALGYQSRTFEDIAVVGGSVRAFDVELASQCPLVVDDAEDGAIGWTVQAPWAIVPDGYEGHAWTESPAGAYAPSANAALTSAPLSFTGYTSAIVEFRSQCDTEPNVDQGRLEFEGSPGIWTSAWRCSGEGGWRDVRVEIPQLAGKAQARIRFRFTSDTQTQQRGWSIDDIVVHGGGPAPCAPPLFTDEFE